MHELEEEVRMMRARLGANPAGSPQVVPTRQLSPAHAAAGGSGGGMANGGLVSLAHGQERIREVITKVDSRVDHAFDQMDGLLKRVDASQLLRRR